ncbi:unnamed protein product, partial [Mesorhabditis belari]|uniref:Globin family profile domain-containing protein n=1 Tax=Mesorhabditis belari TaxID=2138241 RepID=A0AAF3ERH7_9BILA
MGGCSSKREQSPELTDEEIAAVREVWVKAKTEDVGKKILQTLIEKRPKFAEYFGIHSESLDMKALTQVKEFQLQAHRIQNFLDTAVGSLGFCPISSIYDMAHRVGQIHFYRGVNFGAENWLVFKKVTVDQVTIPQDFLHELEKRREEELLRETAEKEGTLPNGQQKLTADVLADLANPYNGENYVARLGWNKLMTVIVREMKKGFLEEAMRNCREEDNNAILNA